MDHPPVDLKNLDKKRIGVIVLSLVSIGPFVAISILTGAGERSGSTDGRGWDGLDVGERALVLGVYFAITAALVGIILWLRHRRRRRLLERIGAVSPGATVFPAMTTAATLTDAIYAGAPTKRIGEQGAGLMAVAVLPDQVEAWFPKESLPRWSVDRADATVRLVRTSVGKSKTWAVEVADDSRSLTFVPVRTKGIKPSTAYAQVLTALGEDPADHIVVSPGSVPGMVEA